MRMLSRVFPLVLAASAMMPAAAFGQTQALRFTGAGSVVSSGVYVGPYQVRTTAAGVLSTTSGTSFEVFCVDYTNHISINQTYTAKVTNLANGNMANTRFGAGELVDYRKAVYLTSQFALNPTSAWGNLHRSIWSLFGSGSPAPGNHAWLTQANTWYATTGVTMDWSNAYVLSDVSINHNTVPGRGGVQEFVMGSYSTPSRNGIGISSSTVPEPSTYALMGVGMLAVFGAARRRSQKARTTV